MDTLAFTGWALSAVEYNQNPGKPFLIMFPNEIDLSVHLQRVCLFPFLLPNFQTFQKLVRLINESTAMFRPLNEAAESVKDAE